MAAAKLEVESLRGRVVILASSAAFLMSSDLSCFLADSPLVLLPPPDFFTEDFLPGDSIGAEGSLDFVSTSFSEVSSLSMRASGSFSSDLESLARSGGCNLREPAPRIRTLELPEI